jgi:predicted phosphodiesterase
MRLAVIADIHGNAPALEAVLADIARSGADQVVHLGDAFNGPIDPAGVLRRLRATPMIHIRGNGERMVLSDDPAVRTRSAVYARERLSAEDLRWIGGWPELFRHADFFACHGSPSSDVEYLVEEPLREGVRLRSAAELEANVRGLATGLVLCAHSHVPRLVRAPDGTCILNPGSVGLPAYALGSPLPHKMEVGSPDARYAIAEKEAEGWRFCHIAVPYDHEHAATAAEREGFPDWAAAIRTGYAG